MNPDMLLYFTLGWIGLGLITFLLSVVFKINAPYGRHHNHKSKFVIPNKWGWVIMELPALLTFPCYIYFFASTLNGYLILLMTLWIIHYFHRTFMFPFRIKTAGKSMPVVIVLSAIFFNMVNGTIIGEYTRITYEDQRSILNASIVFGVMVFFVGMYINMKADYALIKLRNKNQAYSIPNGFLFNYVSCPNHLGEIIEWIGFAIVASHLGAWSFAIWTFLNLVPRSLGHHKWYLERFKNYPKERSAVIPFLL